ncbi:MAG: hypothetical protein AB8I08_24995 [Sandaracinaceae bacterium]
MSSPLPAPQEHVGPKSDAHPLAMMRLAEELAHVGYWWVNANDSAPT